MYTYIFMAKKKAFGIVTKMVLLAIAFVFLPGFWPAAASGAGSVSLAAISDTQLKDLPIGTVVKDSAKWEFKPDNGYTGSGVKKPVEWIIVAKNQPGYPTDSVTLIAKEIIGRYIFDNSTTKGPNAYNATFGYNHWGESGTPNATLGVRPWLNGTFYNHFSQSFKNAILTTVVPSNIWNNGDSYTTEDKVFLPSIMELGIDGKFTYPSGTDWGYFKDDASRIGQLDGKNSYYWSRSPYSLYSCIVCSINSSGGYEYYGSANYSDVGVRPVINLKGDTKFNANGEIVGSEPVVPGAPTEVSAVAGSAQATVSFTAPPDGGSAITGYTVTSNPGNITATGTASPITVSGLTNGISYTFSVTATNAIGTGEASPSSNSVIPVGGSRLKDLPLGTVIKDSAKWEFKPDNGYTGSGVKKPVEWIIAAKNHPGYPADSVTLIAKEIIGRYIFDNSTTKGSNAYNATFGYNHWGESGTPNATLGIRPWLNGTFYDHFSQSFKNAILTTTVPSNVWNNGDSYTTEDKVFLPSITELGIAGKFTYTSGTDWGYFKDDASRIGQLDGKNSYYWSRSPYSLYSCIVCSINSSGGYEYYGSANYTDVGVRPVINLKGDTEINSNGEIPALGNTDTDGMTEMKAASPIVGADRAWTIKLSGLVNEASIEGKIYVTNSQGIIQATTYTVTPNNGCSQIKVNPAGTYSPGNYTLWVRDIESLKGTKIKNQVFLRFTVE